MRVFVAPTQDEVDHLVEEADFIWTTAGELLTSPMLVCDGGKPSRDACGCGRSLTGLVSLRATTLVMVEELVDGDIDELLAASALIEEWSTIEAAPGEIYAQVRDNVVRHAMLIEQLEAVPGDVFRVENGGNENPETWVRKAGVRVDGGPQS